MRFVVSSGLFGEDRKERDIREIMLQYFASSRGCRMTVSRGKRIVDIVERVEWKIIE